MVISPLAIIASDSKPVAIIGWFEPPEPFERLQAAWIQLSKVTRRAVETVPGQRR